MEWMVVLVMAAWMTPLATEPEKEWLQIATADGTIIQTIDGSRHSVSIDPATDTLLRVPDAHLTLTHNHPNSAGLSAADIDQLTKAGVDWIVAVGADGSRYAAKRGALNADALSASLYTAAEMAVRAELRRNYHESHDGLDVSRYVPHLIATVLKNIGALQYRVTLSRELLDAHLHYFTLFSRVVAYATARLTRLEAARQRKR